MSTTATARGAATASVLDAPAQGPAQRRSRPLSDYWDVETARWRTRSPIPPPRQG